ncbi:DUF7504 family protein [Haloglomus salinum]|jgi:hypothetical protein|uniref:DUF7504 family protein n=1 Tax=Haloglomus salinum TaxID=2962673 RepID=UPI0020C93F74|nr:hypothetical protein [Haloglomus salinum]
MAQGWHAARAPTADEPTPEPVQGDVAHAANVLLLSPSMGERAGAPCGGLLCETAAPEGVVLVSLASSPDARLAAWRERATTSPPERVAVLAPGVADGETERLPVPGSDASATVERIGPAPDLVGLWMAISDRLDTWGDGRVVVCLDSLTVLLQFAEPRRTLRFCKTMADRIRVGGHAGHYHLDPSAVGDRAVAAFSRLVDDVAAHPAVDSR